MTEHNCGNCLFSRAGFVTVGGLKDRDVLICARNPPTAHMVETVEAISFGGARKVVKPQTIWPEVTPISWCGEWRWKEDEQ